MYGIRPHRLKSEEELKRLEELSKQWHDLIDKDTVKRIIPIENEEADDLRTL